MNNIFKSNGIKITIIIALFIVMVLAMSYAAFIITRVQTNNNEITSSCFSTTLTNESSSINLSKALPISNEEGLKTTPYTFTLTNTCDLNADYYVIISSKTGSISNDYINYEYNSNNILTLGNATINTLGTDSGYSDSRIIASGTLSKNQNITYNIKVWLNDNTTYNANSYWEGQIKVITRAVAN